jgi:hypothetical protein
MTRRAIVGISIAAVLIAVTLLALPFSKRFRLAILSPAELAPQTPSPPDESCFQTQRALSDLPHTKAIREPNPLSADELAIYRAVLQRWNSTPLRRMNLSNRTTQLQPQDFRDCECLKGFEVQSFAKAARTFHLLTGDVLTGRAIRLVDAELQSTLVQTSDPSSAIRKGASVDAAVDEAFANGLFELSEIAFDKKHRRAIVSYSFVCGSLCGSGGVWLFENVDGIWTKSELVCGGWVS